MTTSTSISYESMKNAYLYSGGGAGLEVQQDKTLAAELGKCSTGLLLSPSSVSEHSVSSSSASSSSSSSSIASTSLLSIPFVGESTCRLTAAFGDGAAGKLEHLGGQEFEPYPRPSHRIDPNESYSESSSFLDNQNMSQPRFAASIKLEVDLEGKHLESSPLLSAVHVSELDKTGQQDAILSETKIASSELFSSYDAPSSDDSSLSSESEDENNLHFGQQQYVDALDRGAEAPTANGSFNFMAPTPSLETTSPKSLDSLITDSAVHAAKAKKRKRRILFTKSQTYELEQRFKKQRYLSSSERESMSQALNLSATQIKIWFQNHRYKIKKNYQEKTSRALKVSSTGGASSKQASAGFEYSFVNQSTASRQPLSGTKAKTIPTSSKPFPDVSSVKDNQIEKPKAFKPQMPVELAFQSPQSLANPVYDQVPSRNPKVQEYAMYTDPSMRSDPSSYDYSRQSPASSYLPAINQQPDSEALLAHKYSSSFSTLGHMSLQDSSANFYQYSSAYPADPAYTSSQYAPGGPLPNQSNLIANSYNTSYSNEFENDSRELAKRQNRPVYKYFNGFSIENNCYSIPAPPLPPPASQSIPMPGKPEPTELTWSAENSRSHESSGLINSLGYTAAYQDAFYLQNRITAGNYAAHHSAAAAAAAGAYISDISTGVNHEFASQVYQGSNEF